MEEDSQRRVIRAKGYPAKRKAQGAKSRGNQAPASEPSLSRLTQDKGHDSWKESTCVAYTSLSAQFRQRVSLLPGNPPNIPLPRYQPEANHLPSTAC